MELEGLKRCFATLEENEIEVHSLTTDRHPSVHKYMRESRPLIKHFYAVWHMSKCNVQHSFLYFEVTKCL